MPHMHYAIVDSAGLPYIQHKGPREATAASGTIYKWIGINKQSSFRER
jgi:hypothetical protein